jgi:hypothetical protein
MPSYRVYCYDGAGKLWIDDRIDAASDEAALLAARGMKAAVKCEVWDRHRLVGTIEPAQQAAGETQPTAG